MLRRPRRVRPRPFRSRADGAASPVGEAIAARGASSAARGVLAIAFAALLATPLVLFAARGAAPSTALVERRMPAPPVRKPRNLDESLAWPRRFDAWYSDHFWSRTQLLAAHNQLVWSVLAQSPSKLERRGHAEWLFTTANRGLDVARGAFPLLPARLDGWVRMLRERERALAQRNVVYVFALAPNKDQIYPEFLLEPWNERGTTRAEQLFEALAGERFAMVLELREALLAEKARDGERGPDDLTYYRLGGHWTDRGAFAAHQALARRLAERGVRLRELEREHFDVRAIGEGDSSASSMYLEGRLRQQAWRWLARNREGLAYDESNVDEEREWTHERVDEGTDGLVFIHDSFGPYLRRYWASSASSVGSYWSSFDLAVVDERAPRALVELYVDRALTHTAPTPWELLPDSAARARFDQLAKLVIARTRALDSLEWSAAGGTRLEARDGALDVSAARGQAVVELSLPAAGLSGAMLRLELSAPVEGRVDLLFRTRREPRWERHNTVSRTFGPGRREFVLEVCDDELEGPWQLRFTPNAQGAYVLHELELRAR